MPDWNLRQVSVWSKTQLSTSVLKIGYSEKLLSLLEKHLTFELQFVNPRFAPRT